MGALQQRVLLYPPWCTHNIQNTEATFIQSNIEVNAVSPDIGVSSLYRIFVA
jgi:hypothetical protein